jgi:immune inhibitor A
VQASTDGGTTWTCLDGNAEGEPFTLPANGRGSSIRGQSAQPVFDDGRQYRFPQMPQTGVKVPDTGTRIRVASVDGTSTRVGVSSG